MKRRDFLKLAEAEVGPLFIDAGFERIEHDCYDYRRLSHGGIFQTIAWDLDHRARPQFCIGCGVNAQVLDADPRGSLLVRSFAGGGMSLNRRYFKAASLQETKTSLEYVRQWVPKGLFPWFDALSDVDALIKSPDIDSSSRANLCMAAGRYREAIPLWEDCLKWLPVQLRNSPFAAKRRAAIMAELDKAKRNA